MADADEGLTGFLNPQGDGDKTFTVGDKEYTLVQVSNPVNWSRLAQAIALSGIGAISISLQGIVNLWGDGVTSIIDGASSYIGDVTVDPGLSGSGVIGALFLPLLRAYRQDLWAGSVEQFGIWGYLVAVGFTLLTLFVTVKGLQQAADRLTGGR